MRGKISLTHSTHYGMRISNNLLHLNTIGMYVLKYECQLSRIFLPITRTHKGWSKSGGVKSD